MSSRHGARPPEPGLGQPQPELEPRPSEGRHQARRGHSGLGVDATGQCPQCVHCGLPRLSPLPNPQLFTRPQKTWSGTERPESHWFNREAAVSGQGYARQGRPRTGPAPQGSSRTPSPHQGLGSAGLHIRQQSQAGRAVAQPRSVRTKLRPRLLTVETRGQACLPERGRKMSIVRMCSPREPRASLPPLHRVPTSALQL